MFVSEDLGQFSFVFFFFNFYAVWICYSTWQKNLSGSNPEDKKPNIFKRVWVLMCDGGLQNSARRKYLTRSPCIFIRVRLTKSTRCFRTIMIVPIDAGCDVMSWQCLKKKFEIFSSNPRRDVQNRVIFWLCWEPCVYRLWKAQTRIWVFHVMQVKPYDLLEKTRGTHSGISDRFFCAPVYGTPLN